MSKVATRKPVALIIEPVDPNEKVLLDVDGRRRDDCPRRLRCCRARCFIEADPTLIAV